MKVSGLNFSNVKAVSGFTLIELMMVIAIIGIVSATSVYSYLGGNPDRRVRGASRDLYAGFREASSQAVIRSRNVTITFNFGATDSYTISDVGGNIETNIFPAWINLYGLAGGSGANAFVYNPRGMINPPGASGSVLIQYAPNNNAATDMGVRVTTAGGISLIDQITDSADYAWQ